MDHFKTVGSLIALIFFSVWGESGYRGTIGSLPIHLVIRENPEWYVQALYVYDKYDTPIPLSGRQSDSALQLYEGNPEKPTAAMTFPASFVSLKTIKGKWVSADGKKSYPVTLTKEYDTQTSTSSETPFEILQTNSLQNIYFKTMVFNESLVGVKLYEKRTDRLIQEIPLDGEFRGIGAVEFGDYNFDGLTDFSLMRESFAGPNTASTYILKDSIGEQFKVSDFDGVSLSFDPETKTIHEFNQCCAGRSIMNSHYKVVNNSMELISENCMEWSDSLNDYTEIPCN